MIIRNGTPHVEIPGVEIPICLIHAGISGARSHIIGDQSSPSRGAILYIPPSSTSSKLQVVFDASFTTSELSLNDLLLVGPTEQSDLYLQLLKFRQCAV